MTLTNVSSSTSNQYQPSEDGVCTYTNELPFYLTMHEDNFLGGSYATSATAARTSNFTKCLENLSDLRKEELIELVHMLTEKQYEGRTTDENGKI